jgi:hypothetical protein
MRVIVLSLVLNQEAAKTLVANIAAHQIIGLPSAVIAETQSEEALSNKQPLPLSCQKKAVGLSMKGQVKALDAYVCEALRLIWKL